MEEQQLINTISEILRKTDIIQKFLKENLTVDVSSEKEYDYGSEYTIVKVTISLGNELICTGSDYIRN